MTGRSHAAWGKCTFPRKRLVKSCTSRLRGDATGLAARSMTIRGQCPVGGMRVRFRARDRLLELPGHRRPKRLYPWFIAMTPGPRHVSVFLLSDLKHSCTWRFGDRNPWDTRLHLRVR